MPTTRARSQFGKYEAQLPPAPTPLGAYQRAVQTGSLLFLSGMLPLRNGAPAYTGWVGGELNLHQARDAVRLAVLNALSSLKAELGSLDRVDRVIRLAVYLQTAHDFHQHAAVADAASELLHDALGERAGHARLVFGVWTLPAGMPVEIELIVRTSARTSGDTHEIL